MFSGCLEVLKTLRNLAHVLWSQVSFASAAEQYSHHGGSRGLSVQRTGRHTGRSKRHAVDSKHAILTGNLKSLNQTKSFMEQGQRNCLQCSCKCPHYVFLTSSKCSWSLGHGLRACFFHSVTSIDNEAVSNQISHCAHGIMQTSFAFFYLYFSFNMKKKSAGACFSTLFNHIGLLIGDSKGFSLTTPALLSFAIFSSSNLGTTPELVAISYKFTLRSSNPMNGTKVICLEQVICLIV